jgi:4-hydroxy-tetrahydrodipicolinate synthase
MFVSDQPLWQGSFVALVTPMDASGAIDVPALRSLLEWHCNAGTSGIVLLGTTGEAPTLTTQEKQQLIDVAKTTLAGRLPLIIGVGSNDTQATCQNANTAANAGADGLLVVTPYYNRPSQAGLIAHFKMVAKATDVPIMLYDVPARSGVRFEMDALSALYEVPNICGIKDASGDLERVLALKSCFPRWSIMTGNDDQLASFMLLGGHGVVSVAANVVPQRLASICARFAEGKREAACAQVAELASLNQALFMKSNPMPVKWALHAMGRMDAGIRLPLLVLEQADRDVLERVLVDLDLMED